MIDRVIICGMRRAKELIPVMDIKQSIGRAGRSYEKSGEAVIICRDNDREYAESCFNEETPPVKSEMNSVESVAFHVLPWIDRIYDDETFSRWYSRTLASQQGFSMKWGDICGYLLETGCIDGELNLTEFGRISVRMYCSPEKMRSMQEKLLEANANGNADEPVSISYILSSDHISVSNANGWELSEYKSAVYSNGYLFEHGEIIHGFAYYCLLTGKSPKWIKNILSQMKNDLGRQFNILEMIAADCGLSELCRSIRISGISAIKKVPVEIASLMDSIGIEKKSSAYELYEMGILNLKELNQSRDLIINDGSDSLKHDLYEHGILQDILAFEMRAAEK